MTRDDIGALLPFYVNGTLEGAERAEVAAAVAADPDLQAEVAALAAVRDTLRAETVQAPGDFGLARLMREIDQEAAAAPRPVAGPGVSGLWRIAAVLALALALGQLGWIVARDSGPAVTLAGDGGGLLVAFAPGTTEAEMRDLLLDLDLVIIDGPTAIGLYRLVPGDPDADAAALRAALQAAPIVESLTDAGD